jgi:hypothetical protein
MALVQKGLFFSIRLRVVVMLERSEASGGGVDFSIFTFLHSDRELLLSFEI